MARINTEKVNTVLGQNTFWFQNRKSEEKVKQISLL